MSLKEQIKKIIRKKIKIFFETLDFQGDEARQLGISKSLHALPRKGIDDSINNFNQVQAKKEKDETQEDRSTDIESNFKSSAPNAYIAPTLTNIFEDATVNSDAQVGQDNLDYDRTSSPKKSVQPFGKKAQDAVDEFNNNIERSLNDIEYPGDTEDMYPPINKTSTPVA